MLALQIRANEGDWGGSRLSDVEAVTRSAASSFAALDDDESIAIVLEATASEDDPPKTLSATSPSGEFVVQLNVRGNLWARLAYQFAHEFCHMLADPRTWTGAEDRFAWIEEALCETASLFALRSMATDWAVEPPYPNWRDYSASLAAYEAKRVSDPARSLPPGVPFASWLADHRPLLESDPGRRDDNTIVAGALLPIFEARHGAWRAVRFLHTWPRSPEAPLADFMQGWAMASPAEHRCVVESIAELVRVGAEDQTAWTTRRSGELRRPSP
jgi:hypothetical protein